MLVSTGALMTSSILWSSICYDKRALEKERARVLVNSRYP